MSRTFFTDRDAVMQHGVGLIVLVGSYRHPELSRNIINSRAAIETFLAAYQVPFISKLYRPSAAALSRAPDTPGRIEMWLSHSAWKGRRRA